MEKVGRIGGRERDREIGEPRKWILPWPGNWPRAYDSKLGAELSAKIVVPSSAPWHTAPSFCHVDVTVASTPTQVSYASTMSYGTEALNLGAVAHGTKPWLQTRVYICQRCKRDFLTKKGKISKMRQHRLQRKGTVIKSCSWYKNWLCAHAMNKRVEQKKITYTKIVVIWLWLKTINATMHACHAWVKKMVVHATTN